MRITSPAPVATKISPLGVPSALGNNIIKDSPSSLTVKVKSVPLIETLALGQQRDAGARSQSHTRIRTDRDRFSTTPNRLDAEGSNKFYSAARNVLDRL